MAKSKVTSPISLIAMLVRTRADIFSLAASQGGRDLTDFEQDRVTALNCTIANATPVSRRDATEQVKVAWELIEPLCDDGTAPPALEVAYVALRAAKQMLAA